MRNVLHNHFSFYVHCDGETIQYFTLGNTKAKRKNNQLEKRENTMFKQYNVSKNLQCSCVQCQMYKKGTGNPVPEVLSVKATKFVHYLILSFKCYC